MSELDELFPPRPGGMVHSTRQQNTAAAAQLPGTAADIETGPTPYQAVRVWVQSADVGTARTLTLSAANPLLPLLRYAPQRRAAVVLAIDNDVYVSNSKGALQNAISSGGSTAEGVFYLPAGIAIPFESQAEFYVGATTTATSTRVSVLISEDSEP